MQGLFEKQKRANQDVVEQIILNHYNKYYRLAYSYVHNDADASDIVQNGAYKALRSSQNLKRMEYAETWVYRIILNECFSFLNQSKEYSYEKMEEEGTRQQVSVEDKYINIDLKRALDDLNKRDKAVVILRYFEDRKLEEIAEILDENISTVKSRLYRSLRKLKTVLSDASKQVDEQNQRIGR